MRGNQQVTIQLVFIAFAIVLLAMAAFRWPSPEPARFHLGWMGVLILAVVEFVARVPW